MLNELNIILETLQPSLPLIEDSLGTISLGCAIILILQPQPIIQERTTIAQTSEISFELLMTTITRIIPLWGLILGVYGIISKSLEMDRFMKEENDRNRKIVFIMAVCAEGLSLLLPVIFK